MADEPKPIEQPNSAPKLPEQKRAMEKAQEDAAHERETERGYQ